MCALAELRAEQQAMNVDIWGFPSISGLEGVGRTGGAPVLKGRKRFGRPLGTTSPSASRFSGLGAPPSSVMFSAGRDGAAASSAPGSAHLSCNGKNSTRVFGKQAVPNAVGSNMLSVCHQPR